MQAPSHFLTGIVIYKLFINLFFIPENLLFRSLFFIIIFITIFFSHFFIDSIASLTYHVPDARPNDKFWLGYHIIILFLTLFCIIYFWNQYWWILIAASLEDIIDWLILKLILRKPPIIHPYIDKFRNKFFSWIPDLREVKWTVINELIILIILVYLIMIL